MRDIDSGKIHVRNFVFKMHRIKSTTHIHKHLKSTIPLIDVLSRYATDSDIQIQLHSLQWGLDKEMQVSATTPQEYWQRPRRMDWHPRERVCSAHAARITSLSYVAVRVANPDVPAKSSRIVVYLYIAS